MEPKEAMQATSAPLPPLRLPVLVFGVVEVRRLNRELEALEEFMRQASLREPGKQIALPRMSRLLDALAAENHLNLLQVADRKRLNEFLRHLETKAPSIHMSFATDPSSAFTAKVVAWLRSNIAPDMLLDIGLQPTIAAGCIVSTTNKIFDMSLRERFADAGGLLLESLEKSGVSQSAPAVQQVAQVSQPATLTAVAPAATPQPVGGSA